MQNELLGAACAFICGGLVSTANYLITKAMTKDKDVSKAYYISSLIRLAVNVVFVVAVFFLSEFLPWKRGTLLIGAALGVTLSTALYTFLLVKK
ncbi:MAG: hypothetical protein PHW77_01860 [Eubacteriales bacterium]|nr:hypothetical protein [Eubacteriales bacterium]